jgi:serine/threonine protein kinase
VRLLLIPSHRRFGLIIPPIRRIKREIAILKKCRHPNVVRLREVIDAPASKKIYLSKLFRARAALPWSPEC